MLQFTFYADLHSVAYGITIIGSSRGIDGENASGIGILRVCRKGDIYRISYLQVHDILLGHIHGDSHAIRRCIGKQSSCRRQTVSRFVADLCDHTILCGIENTITSDESFKGL